MLKYEDEVVEPIYQALKVELVHIDFFDSIHIPTRLSHVGLNETCIEPIVQRIKERNWSLGENGTINYEKVRLILSDRL